MVHGHLKRVKNTVNLIKVASSGSRVGDDGLDGLVRTDEKHRADGQRKSRLFEVGLVQHSPSLGDGAVGVRDDGVVEGGGGHVVDILDPLLVVVHRVHGETSNNTVGLSELLLHLSETAKLGGTDRGEVLGVRAEESPLSFDEFVPLEGAQLSLALEVGDFVTNTKARLISHDLLQFLFERGWRFGGTQKEKGSCWPNSN